MTNMTLRASRRTVGEKRGLTAYLLFLLGIGCSASQVPSEFSGPKPANAHERALRAVADLYLDERLRMAPVRASYVGYHKWDHLLPDFSKKGAIDALLTLNRFSREVRDVDPRSLGTSHKLDRELMLEDIERQVFELKVLKSQTWDTQQYSEVIGGAFHALTTPPQTEAEHSERLQAIIRRMVALPEFLRTARKTLRHPPRLFTEFALAQMKGHREMISRLKRLFLRDPALTKEFEESASVANKALLEFETYLRTVLLRESTGNWQLGKERWRQKLTFSLHAPYDPEELYANAEQALQKTREEMFLLAYPLFLKNWPQDQRHQKINGEEKINYVVGRVINWAANDHGTADSFLADIRGYAEKAKRFIRTKDIISLPPENDPFVIEPTPHFLDGMAVAFYNPAPALTTNQKSAFWVSSVPQSGTNDEKSYLREYNNYILQALTIHEAFPGHYVQLYWSNRSQNISRLRKVLESGPMAEGWACLIEQVLHEEGYSKNDPKNYLFHLKMRLRIFINAMIDVHLHTRIGREADLDQFALELMTGKGFQEKAEATRKLRRAKLTSTQLSTYFVGYEAMNEIYRAAQRKAGANSKPKPILEKMISYGTIPPRMIRKLMKAEGWL